MSYNRVRIELDATAGATTSTQDNQKQQSPVIVFGDKLARDDDAVFINH